MIVPLCFYKCFDVCPNRSLGRNTVDFVAGDSEMQMHVFHGNSTSCVIQNQRLSMEILGLWKGMGGEVDPNLFVLALTKYPTRLFQTSFPLFNDTTVVYINLDSVDTSLSSPACLNESEVELPPLSDSLLSHLGVTSAPTSLPQTQYMSRITQSAPNSTTLPTNVPTTTDSMDNTTNNYTITDLDLENGTSPQLPTVSSPNNSQIIVTGISTLDRGEAEASSLSSTEIASIAGGGGGAMLIAAAVGFAVHQARKRRRWR